MKILSALIVALAATFPVAAATVADAWSTIYPQIEQSIKAPSFPKLTVSPRLSAKGLNTEAINNAIREVSLRGGGHVAIKPGVWPTGPLTLLSGVDLHLEEGATLLFTDDLKEYPLVRTRWEGMDCYNYSPMIYACGQQNIAITGRGTVDGGASRANWWPMCGAAKYDWKEGIISQRIGRPTLQKWNEEGTPVEQRRLGDGFGMRVQLINPVECRNVLIEDVTLLRSPFWVIHPLLCENVIVRGVYIQNDGPNGDGCDPEACKNVLIENCRFDTGDDCIAIKSGRNADGRRSGVRSENIIVRNCFMKNGHGGVVVGSEISAGFKNLFVENCIMDSPQLDRVIRIKTNSCRGGVIEDIYVRNVKVGQCKEAVLKINLDYEAREQCCRGFLPTVQNVYLDSVTCSKSRYGVMIIGLDTVTNIRNINVDNCRFDGVEDGNYLRGLAGDINFSNTYINGSLIRMVDRSLPMSQRMTASEMARQPESYLLDFSTRPKWSYVMGIELEAMLDTYLRYGGDHIRDYCMAYTDTMIGADGSIRGYKYADYNLDNIRTGHFVAAMHEHFPQPKLAGAIALMQRQLDEQPRTREGVYWHKAQYAWQVWLDGIFMGLPFRVMTAKYLPADKAEAIYADAVDQVKKTYDRTFDPTTGLNRHAWDETRDMFWSDSVTGLSQHCWGRAEGWYVMALMELLDALPADYARRGEVSDLLTRALDGVVKWQDPATGVWWQVMDSPGREGNYLESTCSAMMAYTMLKSVRKGYIDRRFLAPGVKAYNGILKEFIREHPEGTISLTKCCSVAGLGPGTSEAVRKAAPHITKDNRRRDGSFAYYISEKVRDNDAKGLGPFIWASLEMEQLQ